MNILNNLLSFLKTRKQNKVTRIMVYFYHLLEYRKISNRSFLKKTAILNDQKFKRKRSKLRMLRYKLELNQNLNKISEHFIQPTIPQKIKSGTKK